MWWNRANFGQFQLVAGHGPGAQGAALPTISKPVAAGSHGCSIRLFGEGKSEIPDRFTEPRLVPGGRR